MCLIPTLMMITRAVTAGERLLEAMEIFSSERDRLNQQSHAEGGVVTLPPNPLLLGLSPLPYLLRALQMIGQANLEQALLVLPFSKVSYDYHLCFICRRLE